MLKRRQEIRIKSELQDVLCIWRWLSLEESSHPRPPAPQPHLNFGVHLWENWSQQETLQTQLLKLDTWKLSSPEAGHVKTHQSSWRLSQNKVKQKGVALTCLDAAEEELGVSLSLQAGWASKREKRNDNLNPGHTKCLPGGHLGENSLRCESRENKEAVQVFSPIPTPFKPWSRGFSHQLYLRSSGVRSRRWGSPGL